MTARPERRRGRHRGPQRANWRRRLGLALVIAAVTLVVVFTASRASAAAGGDPDLAGIALLGADNTPADLPTVINNARTWLLRILLGLASLFAVLGAAMYVAAGDDPARVERAKAAFRGAFFGYALAIMAPIFLSILQGILGVDP